jgi:hypothetical protein
VLVTSVGATVEETDETMGVAETEGSTTFDPETESPSLTASSDCAGEEESEQSLETKIENTLQKKEETGPRSAADETPGARSDTERRSATTLTFCFICESLYHAHRGATR